MTGTAGVDIIKAVPLAAGVSTTEEERSMNYYISDYHFGFGRVNVIDKRTFPSEQARIDTIVSNWNSCVTDEDTVYILGDLIWSEAHEALGVAVLKQLKGRKFLVTGNHDHIESCAALRRELAGHSPLVELVDEGIPLVLCHYPIVFYPHQRKGGIMLYGHIHDSGEQRYLNAWVEAYRKDGLPCNMINVGCMMPHMDFTPRTLRQLLAAAEQN